MSKRDKLRRIRQTSINHTISTTTNVECLHQTSWNDMCANCGIDLKK